MAAVKRLNDDVIAALIVNLSDHFVANYLVKNMDTSHIHTLHVVNQPANASASNRADGVQRMVKSVKI
jgi:hypothetical protein